MPILSICIPTRNRSIYLDNTLAQLTKASVFTDTDEVEIVISDNCSTDNTEDVCKKYKNKFGDKICYYRHPKNINDGNFAFALSLAHGKYAKLNNDNLFFNPGELEKFVSFLKEKTDEDVVFVPNAQCAPGTEPYLCADFNALLDKLSYSITWIGGYCFKSQVFRQLKDPARYSHLNFSQVDIVSRLMKNGSKVSVYPGQVMGSVQLSKKGGYSIPQVFGKNYLTIINEIYDEGRISKAVYNKHKKHLLVSHINPFSFNQKDTCFSHKGYFSSLLPFYWKNIYFYWALISVFAKKLRRAVVCVERDKNTGRKEIKILSAKIKLPKKKNKNRLVTFNCPQANVTVGRYTYGTINAQINANRSERLIIGEFCSIGPNVHFIVSSEHPYECLSSYPFRVHVCGFAAEAGSKGDIVVKDDVWIGLGAIICSGVTIGQGAVVAAGAVVTKDVPPYAIVGGNPAKVIKYRFSKPVIEKLMKFKFSSLTEEKILQLQGALYKEITEENVDSLLKEFSGRV